MAADDAPLPTGRGWSTITDVPTARSVFISHSSADGETAERLRASLVAKLAKRKIDVMLDETGLGPGDEWTSVLHRWLAECDGAVLLLTRAALQKEWVRKEVTVLVWRAALSAHMRVVPVLLDGVSRREVEDAFPAVRVGAHQMVKIAGGVTSEQLSKVVRKIAKSFGREVDSDLMRQWVDELDDQLDPVGRNALARLAEDLQVPRAEWKVATDNRPLAYRLLHAETLLSAGTKVTPVVRTVRDSQRFIDCIAPIGVPPEAAAPILSVLTRPPGRRVAALNAHWADTAHRWIDRAVCNSEYYEKFGFAPPSDGSDMVATVWSDIVVWLRDKTGVRRDSSIARELETIDAIPGRMVVDLPLRTQGRRDGLAPTVVRAVVDRLRETFPHVVVLVLTGRGYAPLEALGVDDVVRVVPGPRGMKAEEHDLSVVDRLRKMVR